MAYENLDYTHLTPEQAKTVDGIAEAIRNKAYGIDVREAMARALEIVSNAISLGGGSESLQLSIKLSDLSQEVKEALTGGAVAVVGENAVGTENIKNNAVTLGKVSFSKEGKNLFDKSKAISRFTLNTSTGDTVANSAYHVSEYIHIESGKDYAFTEINAVAWYDAGKNFIRAFIPAPPWNFKAPDNAAYMRVGMTNARVNIAQVEKGVSRTSYEPYTLLIHNKYIEPTTVNIEDLTFKKSGKNLFNKSDVVVGILTNAEGIVNSGSTAYRTSDFLGIKQGERYAFQKVYKVCWYDTNKNFISVYNFAPAVEGVAQAPTNSAYARITVEVINIDVAQMELGASPTNFEPHRYVIDEKYLPEINREQSPTPPIQSGDDVQTQMAITEKNAHEFIPNATEPLNIPTYEGSGQTTHPSVLYFENSWNGYKYWMAHTPYPNADNQYENPSIVASNDNITWDEPATNPIAPLLPENTYQSDPCIFMNGNTMEMWFRATTGTLTEMFRMKTTDGANWTAREKLFDTDTFEMVRSQTVRVIDGKYCMWYTSGTKTGGVTLKYSESADGKVWTGTKFLNIELDERYTWWHGDVIVENGFYEMIIMCQSDTEPWSVFYTYSYDNVNWVPAMLLIKPTENSLRFDNQQLYRPAFVMVDGEYYVYYSTPSKIALTTGKTIYSLGVEKQDNFPKFFPIATGRTANNAYTSTDTIDEFPTETITYTKIFGQEGFPTAAGILKTDSVWNESENGRQYFYPSGTDDIYVRRAVASGWSSFKLVTTS